jgi:hypothetical protein
MPVVAGGGGAADAGDCPINRSIDRSNSSTLRRSLPAGFALIIVIAAAGTAVGRSDIAELPEKLA